MTVCSGIKYIDLTTGGCKILEIRFSYNQKLQIQKKKVKVALICKSIENKKYNTWGENNNFEKFSAV